MFEHLFSVSSGHVVEVLTGVKKGFAFQHCSPVDFAYGHFEGDAAALFLCLVNVFVSVSLLFIPKRKSIV